MVIVCPSYEWLNEAMKQNNKPQGKNERTNKMNKKIIASLASVAIIVTMVTVASCATNADNKAATNAI